LILVGFFDVALHQVVNPLAMVGEVLEALSIEPERIDDLIMGLEDELVLISDLVVARLDVHVGTHLRSKVFVQELYHRLAETSSQLRSNLIMLEV